MKNKWIGLAIFWLGCIGSVCGQVTGKAFLYGQTDHSGIKVKFIAQSLTAKTDSTVTGADGQFSRSVPLGSYKIEYSKTGYDSRMWKNGATQFVTKPTNVGDIILYSFIPLEGNIKGRLKKNNLYLINKEVQIDENDTLIIEPGTRILASNYGSIKLFGYLFAEGTAQDSISIQSLDRLYGDSAINRWGGLLLKGQQDQVIFRYCIFSDASYLFGSPDGQKKQIGLEITNSRLFDNYYLITNEYYLKVHNCYLHGNNVNFYSSVTNSGYIRKYDIQCNKIVAKLDNSDPFASVFALLPGGYNVNAIIKNNLITYPTGTYSSLNTITCASIIFENNYLYNLANQGLGLNGKGTINNNLFIGDVLSIDNSDSLTFANNIYDSEVNVKNQGNGSSKFIYNLFAKSFIHPAPEYGKNIATNANGDSVDTYYNLFQDPEFLNGKPPYLAPGSPAIGAGIDDQGNPTNIGFDPTGTCLESFFRKEPPIVSTDTNSISGIVHQGSGYMTDGVVMAINKSNNKTYITRIKAGGVFKADSLSKGNYLLYAVPNPASTSTYVPTFYVNKVDINQAVTLPLEWKIIDVDIYLQTKTSLETGTSQINGRFGYGDANTDDTTVYAKNWFGASAAPVGPIALSGNACKNLPVLLYNSAGQVLNSTVSDLDGYFQFGQLPAGEYKVNGQRNGYFTEDNGRVQLSGGQTQTTSFYLVQGQLLGLEDLGLSNGAGTTAYPNPFKEEINIRGFRGQVIITDLTGSVYFSTPSFDNQSIPTEEWPAGIYLLKTGDKVQKIIKQ